MKTMYIAYSGSIRNGHYLGDNLVAIKTAYLFAQNEPCERIVLSLEAGYPLNFMWRKFIDDHQVQVVTDDWPGRDQPGIYAEFDRRRQAKEVHGIRFDTFRELYRRIDGGSRQKALCGSERGLRYRNIFDYFYYGQPGDRPPCRGADLFADDVIYYPRHERRRAVFISPHAKCQGNRTFTWEFWRQVVLKLLAEGIPVTLNDRSRFMQDVRHPLLTTTFEPFEPLVAQVAAHMLAACGNTGTGWLAAASGTPLLAMQPADSYMPDYRYERCGLASLVGIHSLPDAQEVAAAVGERLRPQSVVMTTGCYDLLHAGHLRHLEECRSLGDRLVVALNGDQSVRRLKGPGRPVVPQQERRALLSALRCVDEVRIFDGDTAIDLIREVRPDVLAGGCDYRPEEIIGKEFVESYGGRVHVTGGGRSVSTSQRLRRIQQP